MPQPQAFPSPRTAEVRVLSGRAALRPENDALFDSVLDYVEETAGTPVNPYELVDVLREKGFRLPPDDVSVPKLEKLVDAWGGEMLDYLEERGLGGQWEKMEDGKLVFAVNAKDLKIRELMRAREAAAKKKVSMADEVRDMVWNAPEPEPVREGLLPESELSTNQRKVLAALSRLSVSHAADYPSLDAIANGIANRTKNYSAEGIKKIIGGLVAEQFLFRYRRGGEAYVTTNANVAYAENHKHRPNHAKNDAVAERKLNLATANELVEKLLATEDMLTPKKLLEMQREGGADSIRLNESEIKDVARVLAKQGLLLAGNFKPEEDGVTRSSKREAFRVGLTKEQRELLEQMTPSQRSAYIAQLIS